MERIREVRAGISHMDGADFSYALHDSCKVDVDAVWHANAEICRRRDVCPCRGRSDHRLGWDAAGNQTVSSHQVALDERDAGPESCRPGRDDQSRRPCSDHDQIVPTVGFRVDPVRGMNLLEELIVEVVLRFDESELIFYRRHLEISLNSGPKSAKRSLHSTCTRSTRQIFGQHGVCQNHITSAPVVTSPARRCHSRGGAHYDIRRRHDKSWFLDSPCLRVAL